MAKKSTAPSLTKSTTVHSSKRAPAAKPVSAKSPVKLSAAGKKLADFSKRFEKALRTVPDFPKAGILFKDITTVLKDKKLFAETVDVLASFYKGQKIDKVVSIESRGFIFGAALAYKLGAGFVPVRKPNKLPFTKIREEYALEYGTDALEIHIDAVKKGERVLLHDDLLATGGTARAACNLIEQIGGKVAGLCFLIELPFLNGRDRLKSYPVQSIVK